MLGDGTSVCLNSESELRYPVQFDRGERPGVFTWRRVF